MAWPGNVSSSQFLGSVSGGVPVSLSDVSMLNGSESLSAPWRSFTPLRPLSIAQA